MQVPNPNQSAEGGGQESPREQIINQDLDNDQIIDGPDRNSSYGSDGNIDMQDLAEIPEQINSQNINKPSNIKYHKCPLKEQKRLMVRDPFDLMDFIKVNIKKFQPYHYCEIRGHAVANEDYQSINELSLTERNGFYRINGMVEFP